VLIIGGDQALGNYPTQVLLYDIVSGQTRQTNRGLTSGQFRTTCAAVAGRIFAVGELDTSVQKFLGTNHELDLTDGTWKLRRSMPTGRADAAAASVGGIMYVVGGFNFSQQQRVVEAYNPVADAWTTKKSMQRPRDAPAAAVVNGLIYVMGGLTGTNTITNAVEVYDPARDQ